MRKLAFAAMLCVFLGATLAQETGRSQAQTEVWGREQVLSEVSKVSRQGSLFVAVGRGVSRLALLRQIACAEEDIARTSAHSGPSTAAPSSKVSTGVRRDADDVLQVRLKPSTSGKEGEIVLRITHTWRKKDGEWRIVGGMSCNVNPDGMC